MHEDTNTCFWRYLAASGVIPTSRAVRCEEDARLRWMPLGRVLLGRGLLSINELSRLIEQRASRTDARLGDLAIEAGHCTQDEIDWALAQQRETAEHPLLGLVSDPDIDSEALIGSVYDYIRYLEERVRVFERLAADRVPSGTGRP